MSFDYEGKSLTCENFLCRTDSTPVSKVPFHSRCYAGHASCTSRSSSVSPPPAYNSYRTLSPLAVPAPFFHEPSSPSASGESSRPSHVRGNPANFDEFPRNELKETGAGGRERWTRFGRIVTYDAREDGVGTYRTGLIAREAANRLAPTSRSFNGAVNFSR